MWIIAKINNQSFELFKTEMMKKLINIEIYRPTFLKEVNIKNKVILKKENLFQDYIFCYHENFNKKNILNNFKFTKGLKYFLNNCNFNQKDILKTILFCKKNESDNGMIKNKFILEMKEKKIKFLFGPLRNLIFDLEKIHSKHFQFKIGNLRASTKF